MDKQKKINLLAIILPFLVFQFFSSTINAQYNLVGNANVFQPIPGTYKLTDDKQWENGSLWYINQIDITNSFDLIFELNFGSNDATGADGMTFTLQRKGTNAGEAGGGLGATNIAPSLIVEYDTWQNLDYNDPVYDHIAIGTDSFAANHSNPVDQLAAPVQASASSINIEDGQWHSTRITWDAPSKTLNVYFDCVLRSHYTGDIVTTIFSGNPLVYYGFTASTGGASNEQSVRGFHFGSPQIINKSICIGDSIQIDISGDQSYSWLPATNISSAVSPDPYLFPVVPTQYVATVSNCYLSWNDTINIKVNSLPLPVIADKSICTGDPAAVFDAGAGYSKYLWSVNGSGSNETTSGTAAGNYKCTVTDTNGCKASATGVLTVDTLPAKPVITNHKICMGDSAITFDAGPGYSSYLWSGKGSGVGQSTKGASAGSYTCTVSNALGCKISATGVLTVNALPSPVIASKAICVGDLAATFDAGAGYSKYLWSANGSGSTQTVQGSIAGNYTCTVTDINGCIGSSSAVLTVNSLPVKPTITNKTICKGDPAATFDAGTGYSKYLWSVNGTGTLQTTKGTSAGNYTCTVSNAAGCKISATGILVVNPLPIVSLDNDISICDNNYNKATIIAKYSGTKQLHWSNSENNIDSIVITHAGTYWVQVKDSNQCSITDTIEVINHCEDYKIEMPNVFTPNGDANNDVFKPLHSDDADFQNLAANLHFINFVVYDRWGIMVFNSGANTLPNWDGRFNGSVVSPGTYYYLVYYSNSAQKTYELSGYVTLL